MTTHIPDEFTEEERNRMYVLAFGADAWKAVKAEAERLGRKLNTDEALAIVEQCRKDQEPRQPCEIVTDWTGRKLHLRDGVVYEPSWAGTCHGCFA